MAELDLSQVEEVPVEEVGFPFPIPPVETTIRQAAINVLKGQNEQGAPVTLLQFITPVMIYSIQLDNTASLALSDQIRPSNIVRATAADLPRGGRG